MISSVLRYFCSQNKGYIISVSIPLSESMIVLLSRVSGFMKK
jgi:hypothetical protein